MSVARRVRLKTYVMIVLMVVFGPTGDALLREGMKQTGGVALTSVRSIFEGLERGFQNDIVWMGMLSLIIFFVCYLLVLSWADYSFVGPASAISYAVVTFLGWVALGETVPSLRWVGVLVICLGVFLVGHTPTRTTPETQ
jgi:uncharacterized membrane protein